VVKAKASRPRPQPQGQGHNPQGQGQGQGRHFVASGQGLTSLQILDQKSAQKGLNNGDATLLTTLSRHRSRMKVVIVASPKVAQVQDCWTTTIHGVQNYRPKTERKWQGKEISFQAVSQNGQRCIGKSRSGNPNMGPSAIPLYTSREGITWAIFEILGPPPHLGNGWSY